jgi:hypothetical protein
MIIGAPGVMDWTGMITVLFQITFFLQLSALVTILSLVKLSPSCCIVL